MQLEEVGKNSANFLGYLKFPNQPYKKLYLEIIPCFVFGPYLIFMDNFQIYIIGYETYFLAPMSAPSVMGLPNVQSTPKTTAAERFRKRYDVDTNSAFSPKKKLDFDR